MGLGKTNPKRQMMINMMYLVLTAMLALNVSKQVLLAFELVNTGLEGTNTAFTKKNNDTYDEFAKQKDINKKAIPLYEAAMTVKNESAALIKQIEDIKQNLLTEGGKLKTAEEIYNHPNEDNKTGSDIKSASDIEMGTNFFVGPKEKGGEHGDILQGQMKAYHAKMQTLINNLKLPKDDANALYATLIKINDELPKGVKPDADVKGNAWAHYYFAEVPLVADLTVLTQMQNNVKNTESNIATWLFGQIGKTDYKFDQLVAIVKSDKPIVLSGQPYEAEVFLAAYDSKTSPKIIINGAEQKVEDGKATYKAGTSGEGQKEISGDIVVTNTSTGETKKYPFKQAYQVFVGSAVISATKMNVVYVGLDNPIEISCPGYPADKIIASATGMTLTGANGKFSSKPVDNIAVKEATINVSVKTGDNQIKAMGTKTFRIKRMPKPRIYVGTKEGGPISKVDMSVQSAVFAKLDNFVFEGISYTVTKFTYTFAPKGGGRQVQLETVNGQIIPAALKSLIAGSRSGDKIIIDDVSASGPTGTVKITNGSVFTIL